VVHGELSNELVSLGSIKKDSFYYNLFSKFEKFVYSNVSNVYCVDSRIKLYIENLNLNIKPVLIKNFVHEAYLYDVLNDFQHIRPDIPEKFFYCSRRLVPKNGVHILVKAYKDLVDSKFNQLPMLIIAGNGSEFDYLSDYSKSNNLNIVFLGDVNYDENIYYTSKAFLNIVPSIPIGEYVEAISYSMLESLVFKKPVLVSNVGGLFEVISDNVNGFVFSNGDHLDCSNKIRQILTIAEQELKLITDNGFSTVKKNHSAKSVIEYFLFNEK
jgi:glycosyltransferase involved in cell wall biosynthesis